jgi:hypothetical protein
MSYGLGNNPGGLPSARQLRIRPIPKPLQAGDHYILGKLHDELLPWMICARKVGRQWFVRLAAVFGYIGDFAAALAGLGIGAPAAALLQGKAADNKNALDVLRSVLPPGWFVAGVVALLVWAALRLVIQRQDVVARALLAREYARSIDSLYAKLFQALATPNPMPVIADIQKSVDDRVQDAIKNGIWPWSPPLPPPEALDPDLDNMIDRIRADYMHKWTTPPSGAV